MSNEILTVIHNKIYNDNIFLYQELALNDMDFADKILSESAITLNDIKKVVEENKDLNKIKGIDLKNYIKTDLNAFYSRLLDIRKMSLEEYIRIIIKSDIDYSINLFDYILDYFTYEEGLKLKEAFLERTICSKALNFLSLERKDDLFFKVFLKYQNLKNEEKNTITK